MIGIYSHAIQMAQRNNQTVDEKNDYYVTLEQLEYILQGNYPQADLFLACEWGFRSGEKGRNLEMTLSEFGKVLHGPWPTPTGGR